MRWERLTRKYQVYRRLGLNMKLVANTKLNEAVRYAAALLRDNYSIAESIYVASRNFRVDVHEVASGLRRIEKTLSRD